MRCKKRRPVDCDDFEGDEDFLPGGGDEEMLDDMEDEEDEEETEGLESELEPATQYLNKSNASTLLLQRDGCFECKEKGLPEHMHVVAGY